MIVTRTWAVGAVVAVLAGAAPASGGADALYALRYGAKTNTLVRYDPVALVPAGPALRLGRYAHAWSISPDRRSFVAAAGLRPLGEPSAVRFVDLARGRIEATVALPGESSRVTATAWVGDRVLAVVSGPGSTRLYAIDPDRRVTASSVEIPGTVALGERTPTGLVLLLAPPGEIGPATIATVDRSARVRTVVLERILVGATARGEGADRRQTVRRPGLALSPSGKRAFVLGAGEPPASVDLRTLSVRYAPRRLTAATSKRVDGSVRTAATLPDGRLVVGGYGYGSTSAYGLWLVDPATWSRRLLDRDGGWFRVAGGQLFLRGPRGVGLRILRPSGVESELFRTGSVARVTVVGRRALVTFFTNVKAAVVDLETSRVVRHAVPAYPLVGAGQPIVG